MTKDEVIALARKAEGEEQQHGMWRMHVEDLEHFAALVAAAEREACAYRAGIALLGADRGLSNRVDQAIRVRGQE